MPIRVFDQSNNLNHFNTWEVSSIYKDDYSRRHVALVGDDEYYFPHTIEHRARLMEPLGFYQVNTNQIINLALIDNYDLGKITIKERDYYLTRRRIPEFESFYLPE